MKHLKLIFRCRLRLAIWVMIVQVWPCIRYSAPVPTDNPVRSCNSCSARGSKLCFSCCDVSLLDMMNGTKARNICTPPKTLSGFNPPLPGVYSPLFWQWVEKGDRDLPLGKVQQSLAPSLASSLASSLARCTTPGQEPLPD